MLTVFMIRLNELRYILSEDKNDPLSLGDFADKLGISRQLLAFYLSGKRTPSAEKLLEIASSQKERISVDWLLGLENDPRTFKKDSSVAKYLDLSSETVTKIRALNDKAKTAFEYMVQTDNLPYSFFSEFLEAFYKAVHSEIELPSKEFLDTIHSIVDDNGFAYGLFDDENSEDWKRYRYYFETFILDPQNLQHEIMEQTNDALERMKSYVQHQNGIRLDDVRFDNDEQYRLNLWRRCQAGDRSKEVLEYYPAHHDNKSNSDDEPELPF